MPTPSPRISPLALVPGPDPPYPYLELLLMPDPPTPLEGMPGLPIMALGLDHDHEHKRLELRRNDGLVPNEGVVRESGSIG